MKLTNAALLLSVVATATALGQTAESPATAAARKRQEAIKSVEFIFTIKETTQPGAFSVDDPRSANSGKLFPDKVFTCESTNRILIDGDRIRHEDNHPIPSMRTLDWIRHGILHTSNGETVKMRAGPTDGANRQNGFGSISTPSQQAVADFRLYLPIHLTCRGIRNPSCQNTHLMSNFHPTGQSVKIRQWNSDEYVRDSTNGGPTVRCWINPAQDYTVQRIRLEKASGSAVYVNDVVYHQDESSGLWLPHSWVYTEYDSKGKTTRTFEVSVVSTTVNRDWGAAEFDQTFPAGIEVSDQRDGTYHLVRNDGTLYRLKGPGQDSEEIRAELQSTWFSRNWWWLVGLVASGVGISVLRYLRHVRNRSPLSPARSVPPAEPTT